MKGLEDSAILSIPAILSLGCSEKLNFESGSIPSILSKLSPGVLKQCETAFLWIVIFDAPSGDGIAGIDSI